MYSGGIVELTRLAIMMSPSLLEIKVQGFASFVTEGKFCVAKCD